MVVVGNDAAAAAATGSRPGVGSGGLIDRGCRMG